MAVTTINTKQIRNATVLDEDVDPSAAIAGTKISPNFGSQNVTTTGNLTVPRVHLTPTAVFAASPGYPVLYSDAGVGLRLQGLAGSASQFNVVNASGTQFGIDWLNTGNLQLVPQSGNVGIGLGSNLPNRKLHVQASAGSQDVMTLSNSDFVSGAAGTSLQFAATATSGNTAYSIQTWTAGETAQGPLHLNRFGGNVGIGLGGSAPGSVLDISAATPVVTIRKSSTAVITLSDGVSDFTASTGANQYLNLWSGNTWGAGGSVILQMKDSGNVTGTTLNCATGVTYLSSYLSDIVFLPGTGGSATETLRLNSAGAVSLRGPGYLDVTSGQSGLSTQYWLSRATGQANFAANVPAGGFFTWNIAAVEKFRLDTNGDLGTGTNGSDSRASGSITSGASIFLGVLAGDPSTPVAGQIWYNSTDQQFKGRNATSIVILG